MMAAASIIHEHTKRQRPILRGSTRPHKANIKRNREAHHYKFLKDYFHPTNLIFSEHLFRRRYRMSRDLLLAILRGMRDYDPYSDASLMPPVS